MSGRDPDAPIPKDFQCPYADRGQQACPASICDCFVAEYPEDPFGLHPEAFVVGRPMPCWCDRGGSPESGCPRHSFGTLTDVQRMALDKEMSNG